MAYPARWVEDAAGYGSAVLAGAAIRYLANKNANLSESDPARLLYPAVPAVLGALGAYYLGGVAASAAQGIAHAGAALFGAFAVPMLVTGGKVPARSFVRVKGSAASAPNGVAVVRPAAGVWRI